MGLLVLAALLACVPLALGLNNTLAQTPTVSTRHFRSAFQMLTSHALHHMRC